LHNHYLIYKERKFYGNADIFLNGKKYHGQYLNDGDCLKYHGLVIYYYASFLLVNKFKNLNHASLISTYINDQKFPSTKAKRIILCEENKNMPKAPVLAEVVLEKKTNRLSYSGILMTMAMCAMALFNFYNSSSQGRSLNERLVYLIFPFFMVLSSLIIPAFGSLLSYLAHLKLKRKALREYEERFLDYETNLKEYIQFLRTKFNSYLPLENVVALNRYEDINVMNCEEGIRIPLGYYHGCYFDEKIDIFSKKIEQRIDALYQKEFISKFLKLNNGDNIRIYDNEEGRKFIIDILKYFLLMYDGDLLKLVLYKFPNEIKEELILANHFFDTGRRLFFDNEDELNKYLNENDKEIVLFSFVKCNFGCRSLSLVSADFDIKVENNNLMYRDNIFQLQTLEITWGLLKRLHLYYQNDNLENEIKCLGYDDEIFFSENIDDIDNGLPCPFGFNDIGLIPFNLAEKYEGPHGLIGGTTGSGKSELLISLLLSLCSNNSPRKVRLILIDYKGEVLKNSLTYKGNSLPHIAESFSNFDLEHARRFLISLKNECLKREKLFQQLSIDSGKGILNIDDYNKYSINEKLAHLVIVIDEFAQLKRESPEFMQEIASLARVGRSLGLHLILATQKPRSCIDDEIIANVNFKIALRVQDKYDSVEIIGSDEASKLDEAGSFILACNKQLLKGKNLYTGNSDDMHSLILLNDDISTKYINISSDALISRQLICKKILERDGSTYEDIFLKKPIAKHYYEYDNCNDGMIIGEADDYFHNRHYPLSVDLSKDKTILFFNKQKLDIVYLVKQLNYMLIYIGDSNIVNVNVIDSFTYRDESLIKVLFNKIKLNGLRKENLCLIIEDLSRFLAYSESYKDIFMNFLSRIQEYNIKLIAFTGSVLTLPYRLFFHLDSCISLGPVDKEESYQLWGISARSNEACFCSSDELIPFVPCLAEQYEGEGTGKYLQDIPKVINAEIKEGKILVGYDISLYEPLYIDSCGLDIISYDKKLLARYEGYDKVTINHYDSYQGAGKRILWLGSGAFKQNLFFANLKHDLNDDEGIYWEAGRMSLLKIINV